ncbi:MAG: hypothetical protein ACI8Q1_000820 [Parvicella sp.]|jgi:hypothetical protein
MEAKKVWIYASTRDFTAQELSFIENNSTAFLSSWESHGSKVPGDITIHDNRFIVVFAGDCGDSMCGRAQDSQVNLIKTLEATLQVGLLDRRQVQFLQNDSINSLSLIDFKNEISKGKVTAETIVYNNTISNGEQFPKEWKVQLSDSWHSQLL